MIRHIIYNTGPTFKLNNVYGSPTVGTGNTYYVKSKRSKSWWSTSTKSRWKWDWCMLEYMICRLESGSPIIQLRQL